jgi:hypothetical protein
MDQSDSSTSNPPESRLFFRFLVFALLFCLLPLGIAGFLGFHVLSRDRDYLQTQAVDSLKNDLYRIVCGVDPQYYVSRRLAWVHRRIFSRPFSPEHARRLLNGAKKRWGLSFDAYVFDPKGEFLTPAGVPLRGKTLLKKLWNVLGGSIFRLIHPQDPEDVYAAEYRKHLKTLKMLFGNDFTASQLAIRRGFGWEFRAQSGKGMVFWDVDNRTWRGGSMLVQWTLPPVKTFIERFAATKAPKDSTLVFRENSGSVSVFGKPLEKPFEKQILDEAEVKKRPFFHLNGNLWVTLGNIHGTCILGIPTPDHGMKRKQALWCGFLVGGGLFWLFILFRWFVQKKDFYVSIRIKLIFLFLFSVSIPLMGMFALSWQGLRYRRDGQVAECLKAAQEQLGRIDEGFLQEGKAYLNLFRGLKNHPDVRGNLPALEKRIDDLCRKHRVGGFQIRDISGRLLAALDKETTESLKPFFESFAQVCLERYLPERILSEKASAAGRGNPVTREILEANESGFPKIIESPDTIHPFDFSNAKSWFYWDYYREPNHPAAFIQIFQKGDWAAGYYLEKALRERSSFLGGKFRLFALSDDMPRWFPAGATKEPALAELFNRVRVSQTAFSDRLSWQGNSYLVFGFPGKHLRGYSFLALFPEGEIDRSLQAMKTAVIWGALLSLLFATLIGWVLSDIFLIPITGFSRGIEAIATKNTRFRLSPFQKDEFGELAIAFNDMMENLHELNMARIVQEKLFPKTLLAAGPFRVFGISLPATQLGGDYFDYLLVKDRFLLAFIGDATGHGVPAALVMTMAKSIINGAAELFDTPELLAQRLNHVIFTSMKKSLLMSGVLFWADTVTEEAKVLNFGHPYPIRFSPTSGYEFISLPGSSPFGLLPKIRISVKPFSFNPGDRLMLYTDGLIESISQAQDRDYFAEFAKFASQRMEPSLETTCQRVLHEHPFFRTNDPQPDDFTLVVLECSRENKAS